MGLEMNMLTAASFLTCDIYSISLLYPLLLCEIPSGLLPFSASSTGTCIPKAFKSHRDSPGRSNPQASTVLQAILILNYHEGNQPDLAFPP